MKRLLFLILFCSFKGISQPSPDNIKKICLWLEIHNTETDARFIADIRNARKIISTETSGKEKIAIKVIKIDRKSFGLFKNVVVNKGNLYSLPDTINCKTCNQNSLLTLEVKTEKGKITMAGTNPQAINKDVEYIIGLIMKMVGSAGTNLETVQ